MTDEQRVLWESNGFLTVPNALAPEDLTRVQAAADAAYATWQGDTSRLGGRSAVLHQVQAPIEYDPALLELLWHPTVFPLVRAALGDDVMMIDKTINIY